MILDKKLIWLLISILSYGVAKETKRDLWYINPCTGSISNDAPTDDEIQDCVTATPTKTVQPSSAPTQEQNPLNPDNDKKLCPGSEDCSIDVESDTVVPVMFKYSVETQPGADINALLPELEENILFKLAPSTLDHCLTDEAARTRHLEGSTAPTGICSRPADFQLTAESCDPEKSESNDCFVIMGGLSVAVESGADDAAKDAVKDQILDATKSLMENDELLGSNVAPVEKVKFLEEVDGTKIIVIVDPGISAAIDDTGDEEKLYDAMIIGGACAALLFLVLAFVMFRRKKNYVNVDDAAGLDIMPGVNGSFVGAASYDLGRAATNMDVHHCTSQMCTKCYRSPPTTFLNTVVNENGRFAKENANVSISQSESNTSDFPDINQSESMDSVKTIDFLEDNMKFSCNPFGFQ